MCSQGSSGDAQRAPPTAEPLRDRIAALEDMDASTLKALWSCAWGNAPPKAARRRFLQLGIAWKWQADELGGFRPELARRLSALDGGHKSAAGRITSATDAARRSPP